MAAASRGQRMFVAVVPPAEVRDDLAEFVEPRREHGSGLRWSPPEQWHLTLAFLPSVADRDRDALEERLATAAGRRTPFPARLVGGGAFPDPARAKVLYAGVETVEELDRLATGSRAAAAKAGAEPDGGRFRAHATLARMNRPQEVTRWLRVFSAYRGPAWEVGEITLVASHLGEGPRNRPRHEVVATFTLGPSTAVGQT